jgi:hypothetical protein
MIEVELPLRVESVANLREHWAVKGKRTKLHRHTACVLGPSHPLPVVVTLTRIAPRALDDDNLRSGFKAIRDGVADRLGVDDRDPRIEWRYAEKRGNPKQYAALVRIEPRGAG